MCSWLYNLIIFNIWFAPWKLGQVLLLKDASSSSLRGQWQTPWRNISTYRNRHDFQRWKLLYVLINYFIGKNSLVSRRINIYSRERIDCIVIVKFEKTIKDMRTIDWKPFVNERIGSSLDLFEIYARDVIQLLF